MKYFCDDKRHVVCVPYTVENLHEMARELNIDTCWYHGGKYPHYDVPKRRVEEIAGKCTVVTTREILAIVKNKTGEQTQ